MGIFGVGPQAAAKPNVFGDIHCIVSCNSFVKDPCGLTVGGSRKARVAGPGEASRILFLFLIIYKKTSCGAESSVECRLA